MTDEGAQGQVALLKSKGGHWGLNLISKWKAVVQESPQASAAPLTAQALLFGVVFSEIALPVRK
jgi:hypothetical protein